MLSDNTPAPMRGSSYHPNELLLYGVKLNESENYADIPFDPSVTVLTVETDTGTPVKKQKTISLRLAVKTTDAPEDETSISRNKVSMVVAYGYAFEGGCYRFDRPRLLLFAGKMTEEEATGCGFEPPYKVWRITSKTMLLEVATNIGLAEDLVLAANLPGNRPPNTYGNHMELAHRGGRLNRSGGQ